MDGSEVSQDEGRVPFRWRTGIAWKDRDQISIRGYDVNELTGRLDFGQMVFLVLRGDLPTHTQGEITNAMMVSLAEHAISPSSATTRFAASGGAELSATVAAGVTSLGRLHGTADRPAQMFLDVAARADHHGLSDGESAADTVRQMRARKERMAGFHHAQHVRDPRTARLLELSDELGVSGRHVGIARAMEEATEAAFEGRRLYLNGPGAMGCIGLDAGYLPAELKAMFVVARSLGLCAHSIEEADRERGWRASSGSDMTQPLSLEMQGRQWYDGPRDRHLPDRSL